MAQIQESAAKHTPGPWGLAEGNSRGDKTRHFVWSHAELQEDREDASPHCVAIVGPRECADVLDANGRLIAAAPDLLAALRALLPMVEEWHSEFPRHVGDKEPPAIEAARAALAKAGAA